MSPPENEKEKRQFAVWKAQAALATDDRPADKRNCNRRIAPFDLIAYRVSAD